MSASSTSGELDVLGHDGDPLGVDGAELGALEEPNVSCLNFTILLTDTAKFLAFLFRKNGHSFRTDK